jgi:serine protease Do
LAGHRPIKQPGEEGASRLLRANVAGAQTPAETSAEVIVPDSNELRIYAARAGRLGTRAAPQLVVSALVPTVAFMVGRRVWGLDGAVALALLWNVACLIVRKLRGHSFRALTVIGTVSLIARGALSVATGNTKVFLLTPALITAVIGVIFIGSAFTRKPLLTRVLNDLFGAPSALNPARLERLLRRGSALWGAQQVLTSMVSVWMVEHMSTTAYVELHQLVSWGVFALVMGAATPFCYRDVRLLGDSRARGRASVTMPLRHGSFDPSLSADRRTSDWGRQALPGERRRAQTPIHTNNPTEGGQLMSSSTKLRKRWQLKLGAAGASALASCALLAAPAWAAAPGPNTPGSNAPGSSAPGAAGANDPNGSVLADEVEPATELVDTAVSGTVVYYTLSLNTNALVNWANSNPTVMSAVAASDSATVVDDLLQEINADPSAYLGDGQSNSVNAGFSLQGSGFNVTPNGYIVTNAHVAAPTSDEIAVDLVEASDSTVISQDAQELADQFGNLPVLPDGEQLQVTSEEESLLQQIATTFLADSTQIGQTTTTVYVGGGPNLSVDLTNKGTPAQVIASGQEFPGEDVAILKVQATDLPTVPLAPVPPSVGDTVYAVGYPGDATFDPTNGTVSQDAVANPTISYGVISNFLQSSAANYQYIENTATINHGSSGGPLLNTQGQVVGITTATDSSSQSDGGQGQGGDFFYAVPTSVIQQFLTNNNITPSASPDQSLYNQAITYEVGSHYAAALADLRTAASDGYQTPFLQTEITAAEEDLPHNVPLAPASRASGQAKKSSNGMMVAAGAGAVILVAGLLVAIARRRRRGDNSHEPVSPTIPADAPLTWQSSRPAADMVSTSAANGHREEVQQ